jgi:flavin-dependent dehydrogenase
LDKILLDAAGEAGVEIREGCAVQELLFENGHVCGIRGRLASGQTVSERAQLVIGADGKNSVVAKAVAAAEYDTRPPLTCWYYTYWSGMPVTGATWFARDRRVIGMFPTSDGLTCVLAIWPHAEFHAVRADIESNYMRTMQLAPVVVDLLAGARREERFLGTADLANFYRKPYGDGWVLVGDAGYHKDPVTGQGISDAFCHAELAAAAIDEGLTRKRPLNLALAGYHQTRDRQTKSMYDFTCEFAKLEPPAPPLRAIFEALVHNRHQAGQFFGVISGAVRPEHFFAPENIDALLKGGAPDRI